MKFSAEEVKRVADLARLELTDAEAETFAAQLGKILAHVESLNTVDTKGVEPFVNWLPEVPPQAADTPRAPGSGAALTALAAENVYDSYKVPQVIGGGH